jgi:hypothetical protein
MGRKKSKKIDPEMHFGKDDKRAKEAFKLISNMKENVVVTDYMKNSDRHILEIIKDLLRHVDPLKTLTKEIIIETI